MAQLVGGALDIVGVGNPGCGLQRSDVEIDRVRMFPEYRIIAADPTLGEGLQPFVLISLAGFLAMAITFFAFARGRGRVWAAYSVVSGILFVGSLFLATWGFTQVEPWVDIAGLLQRVAVVTAWAWLTALAYSAIGHSS